MWGEDEAGPREEYEAFGGSVGWAPGLVLITWRGSPEVEHARAIRAAGVKVREVSPAGVATIAFFEGGEFPRFSEGVRSEVGELVRETQDFSLGTALVIAQPGFTTAVVRTFLAGIMFAARTKEALAVFADSQRALEWVRALYDDDVPWTLEDLADLVDRFLASRSAAALDRML